MNDYWVTASYAELWEQRSKRLTCPQVPSGLKPCLLKLSPEPPIPPHPQEAPFQYVTNVGHGGATLPLTTRRSRVKPALRGPLFPSGSSGNHNT